MVKGLISEAPKRKLTSEDMVRMNVGRRYWPCTLAAIPDVCKHKKPLENWLSKIKINLKNGNGLLFKGKYNKGKTASAVICMKNAVVRGGTAYLVRGNSIKDAIINKTMFDPLETIEERMKNVDLLVIDDMGSEYESSFSNSVLEEILRARSDSRRSTIITTNLDGDTLKQKFGESLLNFLSATMAIIECDGFDFRNEERAEAKTTTLESR